jgi:hypothetical protein
MWYPPLSLRAWDDICLPKDLGGLGFKNLEDVNKSLLIKIAWTIASNQDPNLSQILKAKYYPIQLSGMLLNIHQDLCFGLLSSKLFTTYTKTASIRSHRATQSFGIIPGFPYGNNCTLFFNVTIQIKICPTPSLIYGSRAQRFGIFQRSFLSLVLMLQRLFNKFLFLTTTNQIFCVGDHPLKVHALLKKPTNTWLPADLSNQILQEVKLSLLKPKTF